MPVRVCLIGSGNFACAIARNIGQNVVARPDLFEQDVPMWVYEEQVEDRQGVKRNLSSIINETHENVKYLPGVTLPSAVRAETDVVKACEGAHILIFCLPHQFIQRTCDQVRGHIPSSAYAVSLVKGFLPGPDGGFRLVSDVITEHLGVPCSPMMGANLAGEVAEDLFSECTIGCKDKAHGEVLSALFETKNFKISVTEDMKTVEMCGALKNIVGVAAGLVDGLGLKNNTKACIMRLGLLEMMDFIKHCYPESGKTETFLESCGVADLITTCFGGRNRLVGEAFARSKPRKSLHELEKELLNGQKLQGPMTAEEVYTRLEKDGIKDRFPLFVVVNKICKGEVEPEELIATFQRL